MEFSRTSKAILALIATADVKVLRTIANDVLKSAESHNDETIKEYLLDILVGNPVKRVLSEEEVGHCKDYTLDNAYNKDTMNIDSLSVNYVDPINQDVDIEYTCTDSNYKYHYRVSFRYGFKK